MRLPKWILVWGLAAAAGAAAVLLASNERDPVAARGNDFNWVRDEDEVLRVTEASPLELPVFGDYDLWVTVEVHEQAELDIVLRRVEPRSQLTTIDGAQVEQRVPFHGRFHLLRLSTALAGPPYRDTAQALFGGQTGGVRIGPGHAASVHVEARGNRVRANVAGRWMPWTETIDNAGGLAFVARGGPTLIRYLKVRHVLPPSRLLPWAFGAIAGGLLALLGMARGAARRRVAVACVAVLPAGGWLAQELVLRHLLIGTSAATGPLVTAALCGAPLALALVTVRRPGRRVLAALVGVLAGTGMLELSARGELARLRPFEDPRFDLYFGIDSGTAPFDALSRRVRNRGPSVHTLEAAGDRVVFLGGGMIFEASADLAEHAGLLAAIHLQQQLGRPVEGVVFPTVFSHALQQLVLYRRFYRDYRPRAIVFAVSGFEASPTESARARLRLEQLASETQGTGAGLVLPRLLSWEQGGEEPVATPEDLERTLGELLALCREDEIALVLATEPGTEPPMLAVTEAFAKRHQLPLVRDVIRAEKPNVGELVDVLAARLGG